MNRNKTLSSSMCVFTILEYRIIKQLLLYGNLIFPTSGYCVLLFCCNNYLLRSIKWPECGSKKVSLQTRSEKKDRGNSIIDIHLFVFEYYRKYNTRGASYIPGFKNIP